MVMEQGASERKVVIDAGAAIKLQRLDRFGGELFTTGGVVREIKDEKARQLLNTLPIELKVREPTTQDVLFTKQFAKATGDLGFLSQNDMDLIALTVGLHREAGGTVKQRPSQLEASQGSVGFDWAPSSASKPARRSKAREAAPGEWEQVGPVHTTSAEDAAVAHLAEASDKTSVADVLAAVAQAEADDEEGLEDTCNGEDVADTADETAETAIETSTVEDAQPQTVRKEAVSAETAQEEVPVISKESKEEATTEAVDDDSEDGSSAGEWVTQENMHRFGLGVKPAAEVRATCATADYSVQNVLLQMGITPLTFDGYAVRSVKLWGLICRACFEFTRDTQKVFCPKCGNDTVVRVPVVVGEDGQPKVLNTGRPLRLKGSVYSIPKPQGGRGWKPLYAEDEVFLGGRDRVLRHAENLQNKERQARDPFNEDNACRAWYQRGNSSGCKGPGDMPRMKAGLGRVNPNANNYKHKTSGRKNR